MANDATAAAILLCAGKGTRMGRNDRNKVCYDCAGVPVVKRIVENMRQGGVGRFVVVVGYMAESVMGALDGESGIIYAYQKEQKGTGHAAMCGLRALEDIGYSGPVVVSMGDKIVSVSAVENILAGAGNPDAICTCGVQSRLDHPNGGHVMVSDGKALGIVEYADVKLALKNGSEIELCGRKFSAEEVAATEWVNTALYRFETGPLADALASCGSDNAQGEIYLTDTIEYFASRGEVSVYRITDPSDLLTYSTKTELRGISRNFLRNASQIKASHPEFAHLIDRFIERFGDRPAVVARSPGRVNLMGRHIEHRGGGVNVMATGASVAIVAAPREDAIVHLVNADGNYAEREFSLDSVPSAVSTEAWLEWLDGDEAKSDLAVGRGDWGNYVKGAGYRLQSVLDFRLCGMDALVGGDIPVAAGLSSSSALVVASAEALSALNCLDMEDGEFVNLCGEGEWYVGSRGGAGDHAAMRCSRPGTIVHLGFKPFSIGKTVPFPENCSVIVANSLEESKKSEGSKDIFNARVAAYEFALMLVKREFPDHKLVEFRDLAFCADADEVRAMIAAIPARTTRPELLRMLPEIKTRLEAIFATHADPGQYDLHGVAVYGVSEIVRAEMAPRLLAEGRFEEFGELMKISHDGDRVSGAKSTAGVAPGAGLERDCGAYACSTARIDEMCDLMNSTDGVYGSSIAGAGLGGCVLVLVDRSKAASVMDRLNREFYDRLSLPRSAFVCNPSGGSRVVF